MSPLTETHKVILDESIIRKARQFAIAVVETTDYRDSSQEDKQKIIQDHFVSKLGEEAVRLVLENHGRKAVGPDYSIYSANEKSWDSDLYVGDFGIAVKTQSRTLANVFGLSWTFQNIPNGRQDPVLSHPEAWVYFVEYVNNVDPANELIVFPPKQIKTLKFGEPRLSRLRGKKKVVYAESFLNK